MEEHRLPLLSSSCAAGTDLSDVEVLRHILAKFRFSGRASLDNHTDTHCKKLNECHPELFLLLLSKMADYIRRHTAVPVNAG